MPMLWQLLHPSITYDTRGRFHKCESYWYGMDDAQRLRVYRIIESHINNGDGINPNPCYALNDAMQEDEQQQAKLQRAQKKREPQDLNHTALGGKMLGTGEAEIAFYGTQWGIYSQDDIKTFNLLTKKEYEREQARKSVDCADQTHP